MKLILILSAPRSGTNFFCDFLGKAFLNVCSHLELFGNKSNNVKYSYLNKSTVIFLAQEFGFDVNINFYVLAKKVSDELNKLSKIDMVKKILEIPGYDFVSFKIFAYQISDEELYNLIDMADFCIVLDRNPIHRYISHTRSFLCDKWTNYDYSDLKIKFEKKDYLHSKKYISSFFKNILIKCRNDKKKHLKIKYESFCELDTQEKCDFLYYKIFLKNFWDIQMIQQNLTDINVNFQKQNNQSDLSAIIENYDEVKNFIDLQLNEYNTVY